MKMTAGKHRTRWVLLALCALLTAGAAVADSRLRVQVVEASKQEKPSVDPGLEEIAKLLGAHLKFNTFRLKVSRSYAWTESDGLYLGAGLQMKLSNVDGRTGTVEVYRNRERVLRTRILLRPGKPVTVGGFPADGDASLVIALTLQEA